MSQASIGIEHNKGQPSKPQVDLLPYSILQVNAANGCNRNLQLNIEIDPIMLPMRLSIAIPLRLQGITIPSNLLRFNRSINEVLIVNIKRFVEVIITNLVTKYR